MTLISVCRRHKILTTAPPHSLKKIIKFWAGENIKKTEAKRIIPYPPSFSKIAAKIIEPITGASTWALGSHKWIKYIGYFTKNPVIIMIKIKEELLERLPIAAKLTKSVKEKEKRELENVNKTTNKGREAIAV